jgi:hypothetical protein
MTVKVPETIGKWIPKNIEINSLQNIKMFVLQFERERFNYVVNQCFLWKETVELNYKMDKRTKVVKDFMNILVVVSRHYQVTIKDPLKQIKNYS